MGKKLDEAKKYFVIWENRRIGYLLDNRYYDRYGIQAGYVDDEDQIYSTIVKGFTDQEIGIVATILSETSLEVNGDTFQLIAGDDPKLNSTRPARGSPSKEVI